MVLSATQRGNTAYRLEEYDYQPYERKKRSEEVKKAKVQQKPKKQDKLKTMLSIMAAFAVAFIMLLRYVAITEASSNVDRLKKELANLQSANQHMQVQIDGSVDLKKVEEVAINKLGMRRPEKYQTVYVNLKQTDYAEVVGGKKGKAKTQGNFGLIMNSITNVLEYLY